ncbi:excalibur calcium-binding domain-containing protein [Neobacillus bataviensis]|uniref:excalibur calcium-binding domain-containing protein n=1 Tax=Neobacillus bataviensis TaxID=220685 RepID=UPI002958DBB7|nr:excalibur calcium-binding domain-containing protein [Neobacillus bataviensis]
MDAFLGVMGFLGLIVFSIMAIVSAFRKTGKGKKWMLFAAGCFVLMIIGGTISPDAKESAETTKVEDKKDKSGKEQKAVVEDKKKEEAELKAKQEAEQKAKEKAEAELKAKQEAEAKAKEQAEAKAKQEAEAKAQAEAAAKAKAEAEAVAKAQAQAEAQKKQQQETAAKPVQTTQTSFANCTELRKVFPDGVPSSHPAYQAKMDRDHDNYACEQ